MNLQETLKDLEQMEARDRAPATCQVITQHLKELDVLREVRNEAVRELYRHGMTQRAIWKLCGESISRTVLNKVVHSVQQARQAKPLRVRPPREWREGTRPTRDEIEDFLDA